MNHQALPHFRKDPLSRRLENANPTRMNLSYRTVPNRVFSDRLYIGSVEADMHHTALCDGAWDMIKDFAYPAARG